jgi:hypothetical protein
MTDKTEILLKVGLNTHVTFPKNKCYKTVNKGNNKITELRTILQRESQNS